MRRFLGQYALLLRACAEATSVAVAVCNTHAATQHDTYSKLHGRDDVNVPEI